MKLCRTFLALTAVACATSVHAQTLLKDSPVHGVLESYFFGTRLDHGAVHKLTWGEFYWRPTNDLKVMYSFGVVPGGHVTDEAYVSYEKQDFMVRAGRMRTSFGFNDWANLFYNGFNSIPLVRLAPLSDGLNLTRQDSGVEFTKDVGTVQVQAAAFETGLERDQITPNDISTGIVRVQVPAGPFIVGLDALHRLRHDGGIYGLDVRYTAPHVIGRAEYFAGDGPGSGHGGYADVQYRLPNLPRTQLVARSEFLKPGGGGDTLVRHTLGVRQILNEYFQINLNYGWGENLLNAPAFPAGGTDNWSLRAMFQLHF
jgi:hypothetical protein